MIIAIDFDGVIVEERYPEIGPPLPWAEQAMRAIRHAGHDIIINSCRGGKHFVEAWEFLLANEIPFDAFNSNLAEHVIRFGSDSRKISADLYLEDRVIGGFPGWQAVLQHLGLDPIMDVGAGAEGRT